MNSIYLITLTIPIFGFDVFLSSLNDWSFCNDGWKKSDGISDIPVYACPSNAMHLLCLDDNTKLGQILITGIPPHYEVKIVLDVYYAGSYENEYGLVHLDSILISNNTYDANTNMSDFGNQCGVGGSLNLVIQTVKGIISHTASTVDIHVSTNLDELWPSEGYCFRNAQLLISPCHYSCQTCDGGLIDNCLSCYDGSTPLSGQCPKCSNPNFSFQTSFSGCLQECTRSNYLADENKFCKPNNRVSVDSTSFAWAQYEIPSNYDWDLYLNGALQIQKYFNCDDYQLVGMYGKNEIITKSYSFSSTTRNLRIRTSHYMFNIWNQHSQVELLMDGVFVSLIYMKENQFRTVNNQVISSSLGQCSNLAANKNYQFFRTEQIIKITNLNPTFTFKSSQDLWSVGDIYVDSIVCSLYCSTCMDDNNCSVCQANYFLYKGQCISTCPEYSTISGVNCIDFDEETQYTSYLIKAFYSFDSQDTETSLFNLLSSSGTNFQKGNSIYFSYLKDRRIFGGALVWLNAKFGNTYTIPQAHYAVRVRMLVILGDDFGNGQFQYQLNTNSIVTLDRLSPSTSHSQQWGDVWDEYFYQVNTLVSHTTSSFSITVECIGDASKAINQAFCGIANYFVTVLECPTFCDACTDNLSCSSWSTTTPNFDPITHQCFPGYSTDIFSKACLADPVCGNGVLELYEECDDGNYIQADGCFDCQYQCSSLYPNCIHIYPNSCNFGYYLNQFDNICYPICGDGIIVAEEQCEDGNILPFDGCDRCMFSCQDACSDCRNGKCYKCKTGWSLQNGKCQPICGDGIVRGFEICDDTNSYQIVHTCQSNICSYICPNNCHNCTYGVCQQCEGGFKLNQLVNKCENVCGDLNITDFEECDDGNLVPYDGCHLCMFQCQNSCSDCRSGKCYRCKSGWEWKSQTFRCEPICGDGLRVEIEVCDDRIYQLGDVCLACQFECPSYCMTCDYGVCKVCDKGFQLDKTRNDCRPICGDHLIVSNEECDDGNQIPQDGCHECQYQCQDSCLECQGRNCYRCKQGWDWNQQTYKCESICRDGYRSEVEVCDDYNYELGDICFACQFQCPNNCSSCDYGFCKSCELGYQLDKIRNDCQPICGDELIVSNEECDDGNLIPQDGCHQCQFQCQDSCLECQKGKCYRCQSGWEWKSQTFRCEPICGDGLRVETEVCDDRIYQLGDVCQTCQFQCPDYCILCNYGVCKQCDLGFQLDKTRNDCQPICGDELIVSNEECDDGNLIPQDGCHQCQFQCQDSCLECREGSCYRCKSGWEIDINHCRYLCRQDCLICDSQSGVCLVNNQNQSISPICGDKLIVPPEQCDDGNLIFGDGCHNCQFNCQDSCRNCVNGLCLSCQEGYMLNSISQCKPICGDNLTVATEECDYLNFALQGNCQDCKLLCSQFCELCSYGICLECQYNYELDPTSNICYPNILYSSVLKEICTSTSFYECNDNYLNYYLGRISECSIFIQGKCLQCSEGWIFDKIREICIEIKEDNLLVGSEICDVGQSQFMNQWLINFQFSDKCMQCEQNCSICNDGLCVQCEAGYYVSNLNSRCESQCGDLIKTINEQCDNSSDHCLQCLLVCDISCHICNDVKCLLCNPTFKMNIYGQCELITENEIVLIGNQLMYDLNLLREQECQMNCQFCSDNICQQCEYGYYLNDYDQSCQSFCGDQIVSGNEQCDQGLDNSDCIQCRSQCHQIFFQNQCLICIDSICLQCDNEIGWYLNAQGFCETICGDGIVVPTIEKCEDGNVIQYDGCFECQLDCQDVCTQCVEDICYECDTPGWYLIERRCYSKCGDMIIVSGESCDDGNNEMYDGCFECQFQCEERCNKCISGVCFGCVLGWAVNDFNICETVCGDKIVVAPFEDCDDGNQNPFDGCDQCSFQKCENLCTQCIEGICYQCNIEGWQINEVNHKCEPICNDGLVTGTEQCDDMNLIPYDGCFECKFQCHQQCLQCVQGVCKNCDYGYYTDLQQCTSYCGDGKKVETEECDDNNLNDNDGCSKECKIEENWKCTTKEQAISNCYESKMPLLLLSLLTSNSTEMQIVSLTFDIKMQMISQYTEPQFSFYIRNLKESQYNIDKSPIIPFSVKSQWIQYEIFISFKISVFHPVLVVDIQNIANEYNFTINQIEGTINLGDSRVISDGETKATQAAQSFAQVVIYTMVGIAAVAVMTGSLEIIWNLLDILQLLSYIKYINITFPLNLNTFFEIFNLVSISPLLEILGVDAILQAINGGESPFVETINKFKEDKINAYFLSNFQSFLLCFSLAYANHFISQIMAQLIYKMGPWAIRRQNFNILITIHKLGIFFRKSVKGFYYSSFIRIFLANYYDIMFAACIQVNNLNWDNANMALNSGFSIIAMVGQAYLVVAISSKLSSFATNTTVCNKYKYYSIFEGIKQNNHNFWGIQLNSILLLKKFVFMVVIVNCQGNGAIQTIYISLISTIYLAYIIKTKPFQQQSEFIKQIISESVISFSALTFLIYEFQQPLQLNYSQIMMIGWIHIGLFSGILCYTLLIDFYHQILHVIDIIKAKAKLQLHHMENEEQQLEELKDQNQIENESIVYNQCTMCHQYFTEFNILLDLECKIHKIGVCCKIFPADCPQCYQEQNQNVSNNEIERFILPGSSKNTNDHKPISKIWNHALQQHHTQSTPKKVHVDFKNKISLRKSNFFTVRAFR